MLSGTERRYSTIEREAIATCGCLEKLSPCISTSSIPIATDHKPFANMHNNYTFRNKRIDNWLLKSQDLLPQIVAIKYRKGIDNFRPNFLTWYKRMDSHTSCSFHISTNSLNSAIPLPQRYPSNRSSSSDIEWPSGTEI